MTAKVLASNHKCCATCIYWGGYAKPDAFRQWVTFEDERNICNGGGFNRCHVMALASCGMWEQKFKPNR